MLLNQCSYVLYNHVLTPPAIKADLTDTLYFQKFWELAKQVSEFMTWKKVECPFEKDRKILQYLLTAPAFTEDGTSTHTYLLRGGGAPRSRTETNQRRYSLSSMSPLQLCI